ncbi:hypothetical protein Ae201684P_017746 [Aphanomyces euteiches]|nr:hypothetical protein Ae201684P_017746 [Aphanomyces euteiches]
MPSSSETFQAVFPARKLSGRHLQAIIQVSTINLTPANPRHEGSPWRHHAMQNESVAATAVLCYASHNITAPKLRFRMAYDAAFYSQERMNHRVLEAVYGVDSSSHNVQETGFTLLLPGRAVVFPNNIEHRLASFELVDETSCGFLDWVTILLVNPDHPILSTANVPPQQPSWKLSLLRDAMDVSDEILQTILAFQGDTMTLQEAQSHAKMDGQERSACTTTFGTQLNLESISPSSKAPSC